ncbi:MAG: flagellar basal body L-ring protein FlgH [Spirochaetales bacterium]|nr:flagellar basal body L-ring protein FlgH [Spirochaetales bacterium]
MILNIGLAGESLWDPDFDGYISNNRNLSAGDVVIVEISEQSSLTFSGLNNDSKNITFEFSGGEFGNIFSFLPAVRTAKNNKVKGEEKYSFTSSVVARVKELDENKIAFIEGSKQITIDGKSESIAISGYVNPKDLNSEGKIPFSKVADARLSFSTFLQSSEDLLTAEDIMTIVNQPADTATTSPEGTAQPEGTSPLTQTMGLSEEKKRELFLRYINRLADLIFQ